MARYKDSTPFEQRRLSSTQIRSKFPDRIPVIVERNPKSSGVPELDKNKYLAPNDMTVGQFLNVIRRRIKLDSSQALYLFVQDNILPPTSSPISVLYKELRDEDGFLYMLVSSESTFG